MTMRNALVICIWILLVIPLALYAAEFTGSNAICSAAFDWSGCEFPMVNPQTKKLCGKGLPCDASPPGGAVTAKCLTFNNCKGVSTEKGGLGDSKMFMDLMKSIADLLKGKDDKKGDQPPPQQQTQLGCPTGYYQTSDELRRSDPCANYVPPTSNSLLNTNQLGVQGGATSDLLNALGVGTGAGAALDASFGAEAEGTSAGNVSDLLTDRLAPEVEEKTGTQAAQTSGTSSPTSTPASNLGGKVNLSSGTRGNIEVTDAGVTVVAGARDAEANTEVAGFYGSATGGAQPQSVVARMCQNRPWAGSIVTYVIPPSFFDSLCAWRGYQVGAPEAPSQPVVVQQAKLNSPPPATAPEIQISVGEPSVDIWAVPARVTLGTRTSVFWNSKGVESCTVSSPDGSFNESALSGGAATVPLSGATTFTISCLTKSGEPVTDFVTVELAI